MAISNTPWAMEPFPHLLERIYVMYNFFYHTLNYMGKCVQYLSKIQ